MNRREVLAGALAVITGPAAAIGPQREDEAARVVTVTGAIAAEQMGITLPHEHVMVDFIGADQVSPDRYDREKVTAKALPHLKRLRELGCRTLVECTPAYLGRDPVLLQTLSRASGLYLLTNTGYYAARDGKFLPAHARKEAPEQLARRWLEEWREGIGGTGIRPGFIKIGVDAGALPAVSERIVRAAALAHRDSGLTIAAHTGDGAAAMAELALVQREGVDPSAFIWVHAQNEKDGDLHTRAGALGAWVEFDGIGPRTLDRHLELVRGMKRGGLLGRVLLSHDAGWYHVGEGDGGTYRPHDPLFTDFLPALRRAGFTREEVDRLTVHNPREAFAVRVRRR